MAVIPSAYATEEQDVLGVEPVEQINPGDGGSDIAVGVAVDYMGKLVFHVREKGTEEPIEGASIELWVTSLDRYVLFGMSDDEGYYEVDVAYTEQEADYREQYSSDGTKFTGILLRFSSNKNIKWKVYKSGWLEYPTEGVIAELNTLPKTDPVTNETTWVHSVYVDLERETDNPDNPDQTTSGGTTLPKTGVETELIFWVLGLLMLVLASILLFILLRRKRKHEKEGEE